MGKREGTGKRDRRQEREEMGKEQARVKHADKVMKMP